MNQTGSRIDEEFMVRRLIPSDGTVSNGSHGSHCISLKAFSISPGPRRKSSDNPLRNKRIPGQKWCKFCAASSENSRLARNGVKTPVLGITVGPGFTKLPDLQLYELRGVFAVVHTTGTQIFVECMAPVLLDSEP
jgi:hypothetical protein